MRGHADKNRAEVFRAVFTRVCRIYGQNDMLKKSRKREVFGNRLFRPHGYWAGMGCCWNGLPDEKGIETVITDSACSTNSISWNGLPDEKGIETITWPTWIKVLVTGLEWSPR